MIKPKFEKILIKISGEALSGPSQELYHKPILDQLVRDLAAVHEKRIGLAIVVGGGNVFRGQTAFELGIDRVSGDHMGMLGTLINAVALREVLKANGIKAEALSQIDVPGIVEAYSVEKAKGLISQGYIVVLGAGTGNPFFTTDTAAVQKALELSMDAVFKATKVDFVYDRDPVKDPNARHYTSLTYQEVIEKRLGVMDLTAISLAMEFRLPIVVFNLARSGNLLNILEGAGLGTIIWEG